MLEALYEHPWGSHIDYIDLSHNWHFNGKFYYDYKLIPTFKCDSCAQGREFVFVKYH
ncbi:MAG: hypothetical protein SOY99_01855 [Alloprevotella sp.]|nr:hypothetical protein [Bacteroidales bacterium]MDY3942965.1 hypothetical protein [Alloprevotella sp.]